MYNAIDIAKYILYYYKHKDYYISNQRLNKLLYYCQVKSLIINNKPLFSDEILAWDIGPIIRDIYRKYKDFSSTIIPPMTITEKDVNIIDNEDKEFINGILNECMNYSNSVFREMTMKRAPWKDVYQLHKENVITHEHIQNFFKEE